MRFQTGYLVQTGYLAGLLLAFSACESDPAATNLEPDSGIMLESRSGAVVAEEVMQDRLSQITREVALALANSTVRQLVFDALHESIYPEHKLHFGTFLRQNATIAAEMAAARGLGATTDDVLATLDGIIDLEFYMPVKEHFAKWDGGRNVIVASALMDDGRIPVAFDLSGRSVSLPSAEQAPETPTLGLVPVETDFSSVANVPATAPLASAGSSSGALYMTQSYVPDDHEGWLHGSPEFEVHVFVKNPAGTFIDQQCAGDAQSSPFYFDQNNTNWSGPAVRLIDEAGLGTVPSDISMWENDDPNRCTPSGGRPPKTGNGVINDFISWGTRTVVQVTSSGRGKTISTISMGVPVSLAWRLNNQDDIVGAIGGPAAGCWAPTGPVQFDLREPSSGHAFAGSIWLDFQFGTRSPICPPPPLSVFIAGPDEVPPDDYCTWQAIVTGGTAPYSYSWSGALSGSGGFVSGSIGQSSWLYLTVTDAGQNQDSNQIFITVDEELDECEA